MTLEQLSNHEFTCTQDKTDLLASMLFIMSAEGNLLQIESSFLILRSKKVCGTTGPDVKELSTVHVFSDSVVL